MGCIDVPPEDPMPTTTKTRGNGKSRLGTAPVLVPTGHEIQGFGSVRELPVEMGEKARSTSCTLLNEILSDSMILAALYKKHHWNVSGPTFYQLHLLFDKHYGEQAELIDELAERVKMLGGVAVGDPRHAAELTTIERAPDGAEDVPAMLSRLLEAHRVIIAKVRAGVKTTEETEDFGTNDLLMGDVLRRHEMQVWFLSEHLVETPISPN
jgi:starvation-inducible DNA-binding protein